MASMDLCVYYCVQPSYTTQHNTEQFDSFPSYPPDNHHSSINLHQSPQMMSTEGERH